MDKPLSSTEIAFVALVLCLAAIWISADCLGLKSENQELIAQNERLIEANRELIDELNDANFLCQKLEEESDMLPPPNVKGI